MKELKIKLFFLMFRGLIQMTLALKKMHTTLYLLHIYYMFLWLILYFGIKKERLEKSLNTFLLVANILKL